MYSPQKFTGKVTGTASDIYISIGTKPIYVKVLNATALNEYEYIEGETRKLHYDSTNGASMSAGVIITVDERGFTIPAAENAAGDEIYYFVLA